MTKTRKSEPKKTLENNASPEHSISEVVNLIKLMGETGLAELRMESPGLKVSLKKETSPAFAGISTMQNFSQPQMVFQAQQQTQAGKPASTEAAKAAPKVEEGAQYHHICSPMAGTFYRQPSPSSPPYVKEGESVKLGQPLCIIEAMKLMNEIKSEKAGKIVKIVAENAKPVEKGTVLFWVDTKV